MVAIAASTINIPAPLESGYVGQIPVRNLWLLMLYASELFRKLDRATACEIRKQLLRVVEFPDQSHSSELILYNSKNGKGMDFKPITVA